MQTHKMITISSIVLILTLNRYVLSGQCEMTAIKTFHDCVHYCRLTYGLEPQTQRLYYNITTGNCEYKVQCPETQHKYYENRCLGKFESTEIRGVLFNIADDFQYIQSIVHHGNLKAMKYQDMCYPGYTSTLKKIQLQPQVYQLHHCDIKIDQDPYNYPRTHGQYFFWRITEDEQIHEVNYAFTFENPFTFFFLFLLYVELSFFAAAFHHHGTYRMKRIKHYAQKKFKLKK